MSQAKKQLLVVGINGAPHANGMGATLLKRALAQSEREGARTRLFHLSETRLPFYHGNREDKKVPVSAAPLFRTLRRADALILSTPVYWFTMSSLMKNFIEWLTMLEHEAFELEGAVVGCIATCEEDGGQKTINDLIAPLNHMGLLLPPYCSLFYNLNMWEKSEMQWQDTDVELVGRNVVKLAELTKNVDWGTKNTVSKR